ncbi:hypothetical protein F5879DRAFT_1005202 [Lentinula edodes]|nr:hypothetical protein F5879DRAFT_1005202 [Lentinula edodes]
MPRTLMLLTPALGTAGRPSLLNCLHKETTCRYCGRRGLTRPCLQVNNYRGSEVGYGPEMARDNSEVRSRVLACSTHWEWDVGEAISNTLHTLLVSPGIMARVQDWYEQPKWGS